MVRNLDLQKDIIYGPVKSRRLGRSLGVNLLPTAAKVCSFDCIYCQYGLTKIKTTTANGSGFPSVERVAERLETALRAQGEIDYITFSGNGEATLHPQFEQIVEVARELRDKHRPDATLAILSNSTMVHKPEVRRALMRLDKRLMKLDAADDVTFSQINRPGKAIQLKRIVEGLKELRPLVIQAIMLSGTVQNVEGPGLDIWIEAIGEIQPEEVHIYPLDRPPAESDVEKVGQSVLLRIAGALQQRTGIKVAIF